MQTDHRLLIEGRYNELIEAVADISNRGTFTKDCAAPLVKQVLKAAKIAKELETLLGKAINTDWSQK